VRWRLNLYSLHYMISSHFRWISKDISFTRSTLHRNEHYRRELRLEFSLRLLGLHVIEPSNKQAEVKILQLEPQLKLMLFLP